MLLKDESNISLVTRENLVLFICYPILSILTVSLCFFTVLDKAVGQLTQVKLWISILLTCLLVFVGIRLLANNCKSAPRAFLIIGIPALIMFSWFILPDQVPDEIWHIYRAINITWTGEPTLQVPDILTYRMMPLTYADYYNVLMTKDAWSAFHYVDRTLSAYYPHLYLFSGVLAELGKLLKLNPLIAVWMGRLGNSCFYLFCGYQMLKTIPIGKTVSFVYLLNPMILELEASCSADAVLISVSVVFVAVFISALISEERTRRDCLILVILFVLVALSKQAYILMGCYFLSFCLVGKRGSRGRLVIGLSGVIALLGLVALLIIYPVGVDSEIGYAIDLMRQPAEFISVMMKTIWEQLPFWVSSFAGGSLGAFSVATWQPAFWCYLILLALSVVVNEGDSKQLAIGQRHFIWVASIVLVLILVLPFRAWSVKVDGRSDIIQGVQGRYYFPFMLLPLICALNQRNEIVKQGCYFKYGMVIVSILFLDCVAILISFL